MSVVNVSPNLALSAQPDLAAFAGFARQGFNKIVNGRPDGEEPGQPGNQAEARASAAAGLGYAFIPVRSDAITEADVRAFQSAVLETEGPVLAHCRSGLRALILYTLGEVLDGRMARSEVESFGRSLGFDLAAAGRWLDRDAGHSAKVKGFYDQRTGSIQYVVSDPSSRVCAIIDPVLDFDEKSGATATHHADAILDHVAREGLQVAWILDTHPHADHLSAASYLKQRTGAPTAIGAHVVDVQRLWKGIYNLSDFATDGSQWDRLFADGDRFRIGNLDATVMFSPGHTLASVTYLIGNAAFVHDTLFMPDSGTARADFPGGSAKSLWSSIQRILSLPDDTRVFTGHDYQPNGRHARWESTVGEQKSANRHVAGVSEAGFVLSREARDQTLPMPRLILHALQVNMRGGRLPEPEDNGRRYLKFPLDALGQAAW